MSWKGLTLGVIALLSGCSWQMTADWIKEGSEINSSYRRDRYYDTRTVSGMDNYRQAAQLVAERGSQEDTRPAPVSHRPGWRDYDWQK